MESEIVTNSAQETANIGAAIAGDISAYNGDRAVVLCLYGELGSGKTTFTQGIAKGLGIKQRILSPTFIIVRRYLLSNLHRYLYHLDLYRLQHEDELEELGLSEIFADPSAIVVIEWAEKLTENLPQNRIDIWFHVDEKGRHHISMKEFKV